MFPVPWLSLPLKLWLENLQMDLQGYQFCYNKDL